jgi:CBS domain-containing protein
MNSTTLPRAALKAVVSVGKGATVMEACRTMVENNVAATLILEDGKLVGVFTERDVVTRIVLKKKNPETTPVAEVMTTSLATVRDDAERNVALRTMIEKHIRHLPVVNAAGKVVAMLSMRHLLSEDINDLRQTVWALVAEQAADGPGG